MSDPDNEKLIAGLVLAIILIGMLWVLTGCTSASLDVESCAKACGFHGVQNIGTGGSSIKCECRKDDE